MSKTVEGMKAIRGGEFLIRETLPSEIFIPEEFNEEQKMIRQQCKDFLDKEVFNRLDEIDSMKDPKLMPSLLDKAGELGLEACKICSPQGSYSSGLSTKKAQGQATTVQCKGTTKSGTRCKHMTRIANSYCFQHQPE